VFKNKKSLIELNSIRLFIKIYFDAYKEAEYSIKSTILVE